MWPFVSRRWSLPVRALALVVVALVLATWAWWPMMEGAPRTPELDGRYSFHQWEVAKAAVRHYHEFPLWNAFDCRGIPMWDHPESMTASPILLASTWLSGTTTMWIWNIVHCAAGFVSMWLFARREVGLSPTSAFVASSMWAFSTAHISQYAGAHSTLVDFWLAPLLLLLWRRAEHDLRAAVGLGMVIAFMLYEGATYPLPYTVLIVALETLTRLWPPKRLLVIARAGAVTGAVAIGLSAARLLPLVDQLVHNARDKQYPDVDYVGSLYTLKQMFLWREGHWYNKLPSQQYVWGEYIAYIGHVALLLALVGLVVSVRERPWLVVLGAITFLLMLGHFASWSPWTLLQSRVFPFKSMRVPSRFRLIFQMFVALWVAMAIEFVPKWIDRWVRVRTQLATRVHAIFVGAALLAAGDAMGLGKDIIDWMHQGPGESVVEASPRFYYEGEGLADFIDQPRQNRAWLGCRSYEWPANTDAPVWTGDVAQGRVEGDKATLLFIDRTHNTFTFEVDAKEPARVVLNSGFGRGWVTNVGQVVEHDPYPGVFSATNKMLAVDVPAGRHFVKVRYWPRLLSRGIRITQASAVAVALFFLWPLVRRVAKRLRNLRSTSSPPDATR